jgi:hypothetical protein
LGKIFLVMLRKDLPGWSFRKIAPAFTIKKLAKLSQIERADFDYLCTGCRKDGYPVGTHPDNLVVKCLRSLKHRPLCGPTDVTSLVKRAEAGSGRPPSRDTYGLTVLSLKGIRFPADVILVFVR